MKPLCLKNIACLQAHRFSNMLPTSYYNILQYILIYYIWLFTYYYDNRIVGILIQYIPHTESYCAKPQNHNESIWLHMIIYLRWHGQNNKDSQVSQESYSIYSLQEKALACSKYLTYTLLTCDSWPNKIGNMMRLNCLNMLEHTIGVGAFLPRMVRLTLLISPPLVRHSFWKAMSFPSFPSRLFSAASKYLK